jgi:PAS domain S-box-containing protein
MGLMKRLLAPPLFNDEKKTREAYLLHFILLALITIPIPFVVYFLTRMPEDADRALIFIGITEAINISLFFILRRGYVRQASIVSVVTLWMIFTISTATSSSIYGIPYLLGNALVITTAGILLGGRGALTMTLAAILQGGILVHAEERGWAPPDILDDALTTWIAGVILFAVMASLQYIAAREVRVALKRARSSEERYRLISKVSSDYTFSTELDEDGNMRLNWVAGAFENITGYTFDEYVASGGWLAHLHPDDREIDEQDSAKLRANQQVETEVRIYRKDGAMRWVRVYGHPIWDERKNLLVGIVGAVQDITERKQAEMELAYERDLLQIFLDNVPDTVYFKDDASRFVRVNQAQARFLGIANPQDAIHKTDFDFQDPKLAQHFLEEERQIIETGKPVINRVEFNPAADGNPRWLSATKTPVRNASGQIIGTVGISRDITEQKLVEAREARRRAMLERIVLLGQQLTEVNDLRTTLEKIWHGVHHDLGFDRLAIFLYDKDTNTVNGTLGTDNEGRIVEEWDYSRSLDQEKPNSFMRALEQPNGLYFTHNFGVEFEIPERDDMYGVTDFAAVSAWAGDKPVAIITVDNLPSGRPITDMQLESLRLFGGYAGLAIQNARLHTALQAELTHRQALIDELETKNVELERFTYTVSHDLKSPLVTITGFLGYLEKDALAGDTEKIGNNIRRITQAAIRMQALLNDILELSRIGRVMNAPENVPFEEIVSESLEQVRGLLDATNVVVDVQDNLPIIHGDKVRLVEVMQNLVDNAAKFSKGRPQPRIEIGARGTAENNFAVLFVRDNGSGIPPQFHEKIFGLFDKLEPTAEGTGIGLALVKRIIEVHGGRIWVESESDKGATFYFTLPTVGQ